MSDYGKSRADYYREQARQLRALVNLMTQPGLRAELLEIAEQFERLAGQAEHAELKHYDPLRST